MVLMVCHRRLRCCCRCCVNCRRRLSLMLPVYMMVVAAMRAQPVVACKQVASHV